MSINQANHATESQLCARKVETKEMFSWLTWSSQRHDDIGVLFWFVKFIQLLACINYDRSHVTSSNRSLLTILDHVDTALSDRPFFNGFSPSLPPWVRHISCSSPGPNQNLLSAVLSEWNVCLDNTLKELTPLLLRQHV